MTRYEPAPEILSYFTDEALTTNNYGPTEAAKLLTVPAEYRQAVEAEVTRRSSPVTYTAGRRQPVADACQIRSAVVAEVRAQLHRGSSTGRLCVKEIAGNKDFEEIAYIKRQEDQ